MGIDPFDTSDKAGLISDQELSECDREPLHLIGAIQAGAGFALVVSYPRGEILAASANVQELPFVQSRDNATSLLGSGLQSWIPFQLYTLLWDSVAEMQSSRAARTFLFHNHAGDTYAMSLSTTTPSDHSQITCEIEPVQDPSTAGEFFNTVTNLGRVMEFYAHERIVKAACDSVFSLLQEGYDRGMVYRFNDDLSGEIIYEVKRDDVQSSYLGLRFPSSDIPLSARVLYIQNGLRYIRSVDDETVPLHSKHNAPVDLSQCRMRAVSKAHVVYLRNMGVVCSLSLAIVVENELWGLFAFHGYRKPFKPSLHQRIACETITSMVSVRIEALQKKDQSARIIRLSECLMNLKQEQGVIHNLYESGSEILYVVDADVLVGHVQDPRDSENDSVVIGDKSLAPSDFFWSKFANLPNRELCALSTRAALDARGVTAEECPACGIVVFREGRTFILLGRKERSRDVAWGGNPDEPKLRIGGILCPRTSFETFMKKAQMESRSWSSQDLNVISVLRDRICEQAHNWMMKLLENDIQSTNQKYMNAIDRARDNYEFFAHMSHELRTPFHGVMGCLNILHDSMHDMTEAEVMDLLKTALSSGNHMLNLLNDILDISKNKHLSHELASDRVLFRSLTLDSIEGMKSLATSKDIRLSFEILPKDTNCVIVTDRTKIIQIVSNTVNNAIKFTGKGGIDVRFELVDTVQDAVNSWATDVKSHAGVAFVMKDQEMLHDICAVRRRMTTATTAPNQKWLCISVKDKGCGMKPDELAKMFAPYTQSTIGSSKVFQGTGLGLFICVSLCQRLSGFIGCGSTPSLGTCMYVGVPVDVVEGEDVGADQVSSKPLDQKADKFPMKGPIMVVDDNKVNVKILLRALMMQLKLLPNPVDIVSAEGGAEAIELYKRERPSLCIVDYHMPEIDGVAATAAIRQFEEDRNLPRSRIIIYTADAADSTKAMLLESGVDEILSKPPPKGYIAQLVDRMIFDE